MADLSIDMCGIKSPNPFWLASAPPANSGEQVMRAFDAGWGGAVWKTLGDPIVNVSSRFGALDVGLQKIAGFTNIELITDRPLEVNLKEIAEVKRARSAPRNYILGQGVRQNTCIGKTHAQYRRYYRTRRRRREGRRRRPVSYQYDQIDLRPRFKSFHAASPRWHAGHQRRLLRPGRKTHCPSYGRRAGPPSRGQYSNQRDRRNFQLARRG